MAGRTFQRQVVIGGERTVGTVEFVVDRKFIVSVSCGRCGELMKRGHMGRRWTCNCGWSWKPHHQERVRAGKEPAAIFAAPTEGGK